MPSQYPYSEVIYNEYLGVQKVVRAMTPYDLDRLIAAQRAKWREQIARKEKQREREADRDAARLDLERQRQIAEESTEAAKEAIEQYQTILASSLGENLALDWGELLDNREFPVFQFTKPKPNANQIRRSVLGPKPVMRDVPPAPSESPHFLEWILPFLRTRRLERQADAEATTMKRKREARSAYQKQVEQYKARQPHALAAYNSAVRSYKTALDDAKSEYAARRSDFLEAQKAHNDEVRSFRSRYERGCRDAVERFMDSALERSAFPDPIVECPCCQFDERSKTLIVSFWLPTPNDLPNAVEYKYVASRKEVKATLMKAKDFDAFYEDVIHQISLRTMNEAFTADYASAVKAVVFNGWVRGIDQKTGKAFTSCVLSCEASREKFLQLDLAYVTPKECVRGLKGITAGPLAMLAPVKPILELDTDDDRFVESRPILDGVDPQDNLAGMDWEDFEHLVRELFEKEFSAGGGEVRITQASRDRGVDAIAFDPDPIRGGKFVIQAKRYNVAVPVSAVRDLYGTMIAEGAAKGILVTTSYYGRDSQEFAKDKPISLIDGARLVHMFQKHGRDVYIAMLPKGDERRGLGISPRTAGRIA